MSLWYLPKVPALALAAVIEQYAFHPPIPAPPKGADSNKFGRKDYITYLTSWFPTVGDLIFLPCHVFECIGVIAREYPSPLTNRVVSFLFKDPSALDRLKITPAFIIGFFLLVAGGTFRIRCYQTLGKYFTWQLAIFKDHKLITTGPYAVVRHPAYIGFLMASTGFLLLEYAPGSYLWESGMLETTWRFLWGILGLMVVGVQISTVLRIEREDAVMRKEFGSQWQEWAKTTPYKLIPYVY